jgi:MoaA/NifB/PqqE/SkfB family radical SAM enzyme
MIECKNLTNGLRIATDGTFFTCCHTFNNPFKDKNGNNMYANTHTFKEAMESPTRLKMLDEFKHGIRSSSCVVCWSGEDAGFVSKRQRDNDDFKYTQEKFPERKSTDLYYLELNLGNTCNLACRICHISASSKWKKFHHVTDPSTTGMDLEYYSEKYSNAFKNDSIVWDELNKVLPEIRSLDIYGGEPMLIKKQWEVLQSSVDLGHSRKQKMSLNTNGTIVNEDYIKMLSFFENARIGFSIDGVGERFNYLRYYGNWDDVVKNIKIWKEKSSPKTIFEICCTISILNVLYVFELVDFVIENDLKLMVAFVHNPRHLYIGNIPQEYKDIIINELTLEYDKRKNNVDNNIDLNINEKARILHVLNQSHKVIDMLKLPVDYTSTYWNEFQRQTNELDNLRNESFSKTFPELNEIYKIKKINNDVRKINKI